MSTPDPRRGVLGSIFSKPKLSAFDQFLQSPTVQDTLFPLAGGRVPVARSQLLAELLGALGGGNTPAGTAFGGPFPNFINLTPRESAGDLDRVMTHEVGHIADFRDIFPGLREVLENRFNSNFVSGYAATNPTEHFAEVFLGAVNLLRETAMTRELERTFPSDYAPRFRQGLVERVQEADKVLPGVSDAVRILGQHPVFAGSVLSDPSLWQSLRGYPKTEGKATITFERKKKATKQSTSQR